MLRIILLSPLCMFLLLGIRVLFHLIRNPQGLNRTSGWLSALAQCPRCLPTLMYHLTVTVHIDFSAYVLIFGVCGA